MYSLDEDGALNYFETSQDIVTPPTFFFETFISHPTMKEGIINRIHYRLNPTNAATYILRVWSDNPADPYALNRAMLYESPPLQADDLPYDRAERIIPFRVPWPGTIYFSIEWTAAPGNTTGFIEISGVKVN